MGSQQNTNDEIKEIKNIEEDDNSNKNELINSIKSITPINLIESTPPKIVVGIDFGTAGIGYAYSFYENQKNIILSDLKDQLDNKVPTEIILDNDLNDVLAFGNECAGYIRAYPKESYQYFKNIKMNLYKKKYFIKSTDGKEADIEKIISKILKIISDEAISQIRRTSHKNYEKDEIKWVVTIPAIWEEKSKQIMINASKKAGLINDQTDLSLFLALEPEVAGIYYFSDLYSRVNDEDEYTPYIICDIGAGTVDVCCYRKEKQEGDTKPLNINSKENIFDSFLIEEYPPIGGDYGGNYINEELIKRLIIEIFGEERVEKVKNDIKNEKWKEFETKIEALKKDFSSHEPYDCKLDCKLFKDKETKKKLDDYITEYNNKQHKYKYQIKRNPDEKWELMFPSQVFVDITKEVSEKIFSKLEEVYNEVKNAQIIFTGAGSKNTNIINYMYDFTKEKNLDFKFGFAYQPEVSILKGSVLFGFQSNLIRKRKSKYTIGIKTSRDWDENLYKKNGIKKFNDMEKKWKCTNLFSKFITRNEYIEFNEIKSRKYVAIQKKPSIIFYKTLKNDCKYIDEKDENNKLIIKKFGEVIFDIENGFDMENRNVRINLKLGGTYIYATAEYLKNGKKLEIMQNFY
jgi:hypothetical protein